jgi:5-hydroxyisourate hydrolase-like protein (transthyretin family)
MKKQLSLLLACIFAATIDSPAQTPVQQFYLDFGKSDATNGNLTTAADANGNYWTNVYSSESGSPSTKAAGYTVTLVNSTNQTTGYQLETTTAWHANGRNNGALLNPDPALLGDLAVASATEDYFFVESNMNNKGAFVFKNLDPAKAYKFYVYGSRQENAVRTGVISINGKNGSHGRHQNSGSGIGTNIPNTNDNTIWQSTLVFPKSNGEIMFELGIEAGGFAYINAMKAEEYTGFTLPEAEKRLYVDFGKNNSGLDGSPTASPDANGNYWNNIYSNGDGPTTQNAHFMDINLVFSDNAASGYRLETGSQIQWNGVRNGALTNPDPALLGDLAIATATHDYLFIDGSQTAVLQFKKLNRQKQYRFNIFGSRDDSGVNRIGFIELRGGNTIKGLHQMGGANIGGAGINRNTKNIFVSDLIVPASDSSITLEMTRWYGMNHINCIKLEEITGAELPEATQIVLSGSNAITQCGGSIQLSATALPQGALLPAIVWSVDDEAIARITETGKLYAKANGTVTVTATATLEEGAVLTASKAITVSGQSIGDYSFTVMGSSVPWGQGADPRNVNGYAWKWTSYLQNNAANTWTTNNISIGGNTTTDVTNRWDSDLLPSCSRYVYYGLSLGNEGIHENGEAAFVSWRNNMLKLIERTKSHDKIAIVGNNYPRGDFNATDYGYVKRLNLLIHEWDVASVNLLGAIDNGYGQWASNYIADNAHPNTAGHAEMFYVVVPSLLDALALEKPQPLRTGNTSLTLDKTNPKRIAFTPENILHSFTLVFSFKTTGAGTLASLVFQNGDTARLILGNDGKLTYKNQTSYNALNDDWHTASLTHYHALGTTQLYIDGARISRTTPESEKLVPVKFFINDFENAPQSVEYRELFLYRAGMCADEIAALQEGKMLKSSLEIYAPLDGGAATEAEALSNLAQSLNTLTLEKQNISGLDKTYLDKNVEVREIVVYSLTGQRLLRTTEMNSNNSKKLSAGAYIAKIVTTEGNILSRKIVVE